MCGHDIQQTRCESEEVTHILKHLKMTENPTFKRKRGKEASEICIPSTQDISPRRVTSTLSARTQDLHPIYPQPPSSQHLTRKLLSHIQKQLVHQLISQSISCNVPSENLILRGTHIACFSLICNAGVEWTPRFGYLP